jgi:hypothetical protein
MISFFHLPGSNEIVARLFRGEGLLANRSPPTSEDAGYNSLRQVWYLNIN